MAKKSMKMLVRIQQVVLIIFMYLAYSRAKSPAIKGTFWANGSTIIFILAAYLICFSLLHNRFKTSTNMKKFSISFYLPGQFGLKGENFDGNNEGEAIIKFRDKYGEQASFEGMKVVK